MKQLVALILDLIYPRICANCGLMGRAWCATCADKLAAYPFAGRWRTLDSHLATVTFAPYQGMVRDALRALKFNDAVELAPLFAEALSDELLRCAPSVDLIVPMPLHSKRLRMRGYNQSALLAAEFSAILKIPCADDVVLRTRSTGTQVGKSAAARRIAVENAFSATADLSGCRVLLVDDIVTTGSTLSACATALFQAGAADVIGACVASV